MSPIAATTESNIRNGNSAADTRFVISPPESPHPNEPSKSQCSSLSDGENFEWSGETADIDADSGIVNDRNGG